MAITDANSLLQFLMGSEYADRIKEYIDQRAFTIHNYEGFIDTLRDALREVAGESVTEEQLRGVEFDTYKELFPSISIGLYNASLGEAPSEEVTRNKSFWTDFSTNATDPFRGIQNYVDRFNKQYKQLTERRVSSVSDLVSDTNSRLTSLPSYQAGNLKQGLEAATEHGARRLIASMPSIKESLDRQIKDYANPSGFVMRPTGLDVYSMLNSEENKELGFRGFVFQFQSTNAIAGVLERTGPTVVGTQGYTGTLKNDSQPDAAASILVGNDLSIKTAELYKPGRIKPVYQDEGSAHAKIGYFYGQEKDGVVKEEGPSEIGLINKVVISTQNWTSTLDRSTTVEEMLLLNRKDARSQTAFDILARQSKAAVDALLELTNNKLSSSTTQKDFKGQYESKLGVFKDEPAKILFVNDEIHKQIAGKLKDAYENQDRAALSIQYIENVLNPEKGANQELMPFGMQRKDGKLVVGAGFEALENLASEGRLSIAITATSHGQDQGLFKLLDAYKRIEEKDISLRTEVEQRKYSLIKTMLEKGAFTMMPSQFMHSKSFAILGQNNQLKAYGAGSANLSTYAHEKNIEVMAIFDSVVRGTEDDQFRTLDALDKQTEDDIQQAYLYGYSRFHLEDRTQYQGLLIEQRGKDKEKIAKLGYDYLAAMGGVEASSWDDPAAKGKKFIYSKRYLVGKGDASAVGATIQIASPIAGQAGYSFAVTFGGEQVMHGKGPDGMQPVVYLNKSQRLIAGMVYKNASGSSKVYNVFDLQGETGQLQQRALEHGDSYQANAFDVLGGLIETTYYAMRYEHQVRGLYAAYGMAEKDTFEGSLRRYVGVLMGKSLEGSGLNLKSLKGTNDLYAVASDFVESINGEPKRKVNQLFNTLQQQLTKHLGTSVEQYNTFRPVMAKTAAMDDQRMTFMNEQVHRLLEGLKTIQQSGQITPDAVKAQVDAFTKAVTAEVNRSLNFGNFAPGQNHFTGLYNDLVMQAIDLTPSLKDIYRSEIELGKREAFSNMVDIFSQPHETGFSFGQGFHRLPVYGEDQYINNAYSILRSGDASAFIMSPYALMHGEALGQYSGEYLRAVASSGRLKFQDPYTRYGGLLKLEGGAPVVHELESLMKSMPGLDVVRKEEYITEIESFLKKDIEVDGETTAGLSKKEANKIATQLAEETFSRYRDQRLEAKRLGEDYNEDDETLYFFPFAKSEQISQRMKNLTSTRPIFNASAEFVKYAMSLGAVKGYDSSNSKLSLGGNVLATLTAQQYKALTQEYLRRYRKTHPTDNSADKELLDKVDTALLREIAQELTVDQKQLTKGFLGGYAPRRIVIVDGASQLSDSGLLNAGLKDNGNTIKYVQPHVVQATSTLDSFIASPAKLNQVVQKQLRPGTIFLARDLKIEENDIVTQLNKKLNANVQTALEAAGSVVTQMPESTKGTFNLTAYIDTVSSLSGLDAPIAKQLVLNALKDLKKEFKNIKIEYGRDRENIEFYYAKGVYSPADSKTLDDGDSGKIQYIEGLSKIGEIVGSEIGQGLSVTINDLFQYSSVTGDGRARPITFSIPAVSALELGPAISVLSEALFTVSGGNTVILDLDLQTLKDFKEGMRGGLDTAKGPMRTAEEDFWTTVKTFTESTQKLLPKRVAAQEVFAMLSSSQIKGFNFGMGLGLLEEKEQSGIYQLIKQSDSKDKAGGGRAVAEALAMFLLTRSDLEDVSGLRGVLATSLETFTYKDGRSRTQYAEALQIRNRAKPDEKGKQLKGIDKDLSSSLDYFGQLAALVDPSRMLGKTLQEALSEQVTLALQGDDRALKQLQTGTLKLFGRAFEDSFKSGDGVHTLLDDFSSRPAGLLAFLIKASQDVFQNVDVKERLSKAGLAEVSLDKQSVFTQDYSTDATADGYLRKLSSVVSPGTSYAGKIKSTLIKHEITELIRNISELNSGDITRYRANDQSLSIDNVGAYLAKLAEVKGATGTERLRLQKEANVLGAKLGTTGFNMDSLESMLKLGYHPIVEAYKESTGRADFENFIKLEPNVAAAELKAFIAVGNAAKVEGKLRQNRLPEFTATQSNIKEIQKLTGNKLSLETVYELIELYGKDGESRLLNTAKDSNLATYTALELYGRFGELGRKLGTGIEEIASRFGYSLPDSDEIKRILQKLKDNNTITAEEELKLKEVEAVYEAVRTYLQTQRMIELPGEYTPGKLTVPTGMKNITALEGHYAQGLTKKQLEMYTYNPKNEHDVGTIQQALVSLAMIYEGAVPSQRRVQAKYGLQMHNVTDSAIVQHLMQKEEPTLASVGYQKDTTSMLIQYKDQRLLGTQEQTEKGLAFKELTNQAVADEFVATFLTHYTGFAKHNLPGSINRLGELETRSIGERAVHQFIDIGSQYSNEKDLLPDIEAMVKYAHFTRHNLGDSLSYEDNINRRVDLIVQEAETGLTEKLKQGYTINVVNAIIKRANEERVTLGDDFDMQQFLDTIYKSNESIAIDNNQVVKLRDLSLEEKQLQRSIINAKVEAPTESTQNVLRTGIKNYAETLRPTIQQRVINTFRTDTGAEYLEGMELLYKSALQQADYYSKVLGDTELSKYDRDLANNQLGRAEALQRSLKTSRFVSLPSLVVIDQHSVNEQGEFTGKNVVTIGAERSAQTGVILGLDILQKMSLLFNAESHPALEAQFSLVAKLQKTQHLINRIQFNALNNKNTDISDEELKDLQELPLLMHHTKQTTIDLIHNKNNIRQATANRLGMSGTSYIAVNSFLVGMDEVGLGDRINRAAGTDSGNGMSRLASSIDKDLRKQAELFKIVSASGHRGYIQYEMTVSNEKDKLAEFLTNINPNNGLAPEAQSLLKSLNAINDVDDIETIQKVLLKVKSFIVKYGDSINTQLTLLNGAEQGTVKSTLQIKLMEERKALSQRIKNIDSSISYLNGDKLIGSYTPYLKFGVSSDSLAYHQSKLERAEKTKDFFTTKLEKTKEALARQTKAVNSLPIEITLKDTFLKEQEGYLSSNIERLQKRVEVIYSADEHSLMKDLVQIDSELRPALEAFKALPENQKSSSSLLSMLGFELRNEGEIGKVAGGLAAYTPEDYRKFVFNVEESSIASSFLKDIKTDKNDLLEVTKLQLKTLKETFRSIQSEITGTSRKELKETGRYLSLEQIFTENSTLAKLMRAEYFKQLDPVKIEKNDALYLAKHRLQQQLQRLPIEKEVFSLKVEYLEERKRDLDNQITKAQQKSIFLYGALNEDIPKTPEALEYKDKYDTTRSEINSLFEQLESTEGKLRSTKISDNLEESQHKLTELQTEVNQLTNRLMSAEVENKDFLKIKDDYMLKAPSTDGAAETLSLANLLDNLKGQVRKLKKSVIFENIKPVEEQLQSLKARLLMATEAKSNLEIQLNTTWVNSNGEAQQEGLISLQAKAADLVQTRKAELTAKQEAYAQVSDQHREYQDFMLERQQYYAAQIKQLVAAGNSNASAEINDAIEEYTKKLDAIKEITEGKTRDISAITRQLDSFGAELSGNDEALSKLESVKQYVSGQTNKYSAPEYFKVNVDFGLSQEGAKQKAEFVSELVSYQKLKQTGTYVVNERYETEIQSRLDVAGITGNLVDPTGTVIATKDQLTERVLNQELDIYDNYPDIAKFTKQLSGWANLLKDYAHKFNNPNAQLITEQDLFARLMRNESLDYIVVASVTGREWDKNELQKGIEQVESIIGIGAVMTGRQGAPFGTSSPPSGHALNAMAKQGIYITEVNRRARELNSYLVSDESSASTLMLISAFGFEFTGLGDYDGDSFQAALTKINEATGTISEATVKIKRLERQLESVKREIDRYGTDTYQTGELKRQEAAIESELNNTKQAKTKAEQLVQHNKDEIARHQEGRTTHAYEGLRSYIGSYVALPEQVVGDRQISELTVFRDEALRGTVKQYRDTLGGFNWDTGLQRGEIGNYVYATALKFDNDNKLKNVTFSKYIEDLGERRSGKIAEDFKFWSSQFEQSSRYTAFLAEHGNKLEAKDREDYIQEVSAYQAEMESTVMSMFTMKKILGNVTGTTIDPSNLGSMQAIMGTTGGSLLGKVYNTVVPISAGLAANTSFNRMLLDPDLVGRFNQSVEAGFENVIGDNTNLEVAAALTSVKEMLTQTAVSGQTTEIIPWRIAQRQTEESSGVMYRFLLTAQQYLRDSALKPKQAGGLVGRIREYTVTEAAIEQLKAAGINEEESLKDLTGYDEIIRRERQFTNNEQKAKYIQIISQDFLGTVANEALHYNYGSAVRGESVAETEGLTAFAALRLLTDYIGGTGNSAANLMESSTYSKTLQGIKARYENELKEKTLSEDLQRRLVSAGKIDDSKLVNYVLTDMLNKFQSQFIIKANLENTDFIKIQETEAALKLYGLDDKGDIKDSGALQFAAMEDYVKDVQSYLDINTGVDSGDSKLFSAEAYAILNGIQNPDASREERMALVEEKAKDRLNAKYNDAQTEAQIEGRLKERQAQVEADMKAQRTAIQAAIKEETARNEGNTLSDGQLTKAVFTGLIENRISSQTEALMPALENLRAFNQAVNEVASSGKTSKLSKALLDQQSTYSALAMEFQAQQYALDSGKLVGESLPKAFSQTVLNIVDAIQEREGTPNASGKLVMTDSEMKAVMAAMALGGALPQNVLPMVEAATQGLSQENKNEFQLKLIRALTTQGGALEQVANANAYQTAQLGMSGLKNTLTDMLTEETKKLESMEAGTAEAEIQIKKIEELTKANQITQKEFNQNYDEYITQQEERKSQQEGFISPKTNIERMLDTIAEQSARSNELVRATTQRAELHQQLRQTHTLAEGISILAVPLLFSAMQGDIMTSKEQLTSLGADILQSAVMSNSYEESALRNFISPTTDSAALKRMANIGDKFQFGRMQQFLMNYESPTEGLARAALSELVYSGAAMTGSLLGQAIDTRREGLAGMPGVSGQTGTGRVITEVAGGVIGMAVGGMVSQRPLPETTVTQDEFMADVVKGMVQSYQNIQNYLSQNLLGNEDDDMEVMDPDSNEPIALGLSQGDIRPTATGTNVAALSVQEYLQVISEDTDSPTTAQLLGLA